jgi:DNA-binding transcriptional MerR regulator
MPHTEKPHTDDGRPYLKMKALVEATGAPKSTILLYVAKGLLPEPVRTRPNMAYYHPACVARVAFIKQAQTRHRLPLAAIKGLLKEMDKGRDVAPLIELQTTLFSTHGRLLGTAAFCRATGLNAGQVAALCDARILLPVTEGRFDAEDLAIGRLLKNVFDQGVAIADLAFYPTMADAMVENEIALRETLTRELSFEHDAAFTLELTRMARGLRAYVIDRVMQKRLIAFKGLKNRNPANEENGP